MLYVQWQCLASSVKTQKTINTNSTTNCSTLLPYIPNGKCPNGSPYEPTFLTTSAMTHFEYPIYEQEACQGGKIVLVCSHGLVISIYAAYYGIQKNTLTNCNEQTHETSQSNQLSQYRITCYYPSTYHSIVQSCANQSTCQLNSSFFEDVDPCPAYSKQLFIQYQCVNSFALNSAINTCDIQTALPSICPARESKSIDLSEKTWCFIDNSYMNISCNLDQSIEIICAFYGLHPSIRECHLPESKPICYFESSSSAIKSACNGMQACSIDFASFPDPCRGMDKALYVQWRCT